MIKMPIWEQLVPWLILQLLQDLTDSQIIQLLGYFGRPENILNASSETLAKLLPQKSIIAIQELPKNILLNKQLLQTQAWLNECDQHIILTIDHPFYPEKLHQLKVPPPVLFVSGNFSFFNTPRIAIVGFERPSIPGKALIERFAKSFSLAGWTVMSGLELGINTASLYGALSGSKQAVAILTTGLNQIYPIENKLLVKQLENDGLLVIETSKDSPIYHSALQALKKGVPVFAVPGLIGNIQNKGCHSLIRQGATLVDDPAQIIEALSECIVA
ncbi:MAG: hypothetical protein HAW62_00195 [Endozoicomonadaceae bacterium]|nr:hypothetical protein [Endozoicomonadaceae bacterium]